LVDLAEIQAAYYMVAATGVLIAAVFYILNLRISRKNQELSLRALEQSAQAQQQTLETRQAQLLMSIYMKWQEPEFQDAFHEIIQWEWKDFDDNWEKYGSVSNPEKWSKRAIVGTYLEGLGVFVKRGFIDPRLVDDLMSSYIITFWQKFGPVTKEMRKRLNDPTAAEHIEYLYDVVYEIYKQQHPETAEPGHPS
jgi:hypothetical protein